MLITSAGKAVVILGTIALTTTFCSASVIPLHLPLAPTLTASSQPDANPLDLLPRRHLPPFRRSSHFVDNGLETQDEEKYCDPSNDDNKDNECKDDNFEIYKTKQPNTPPSSQPSDPFAFYNYQSALSTNFQGTSTFARRTIVVGDIHGSLAGFEGFLAQIAYDSSNDQLILAGDLVAKGPESLRVIDKALSLNALCVRGNHDDKVIRWRGYLDSLSAQQLTALDLDSASRPTVADIDAMPEYDPDRPDLRPLAQLRSIPADLVENSEHHRIAKAMTPQQYQYLAGCPLVLAVPRELSAKKVPVYVVHAGIDPAVGIQEQQPWVLMNVRNLLNDGTPNRQKKKGQGWAKAFNDGSARGMVLVYGHDAGRSLNVKEWSVGLDSGCVYGRALSGYVVETGQVYTVPCKIMAEPDEEYV
ncbi:hypothetical protein BG006_000748 [Podila minutissima]|uniref:Calcineurin-like phosphoesterase domain-containing protein n=1 Tax=Podila minutissima TaxID=64525 RepID=A0A9P5STX6_9FUNG|nr:hypothetical protein BG006_000748 [Podila minutissima]